MRVLPPKNLKSRWSAGMPRTSSIFAQDSGITGCARMAIWRTTSAVTYSTVRCRSGSVFVRHHGPDRIESLMNLLARHGGSRQPDHAIGLRQDRRVVVAESARFGQHAP